LWHDAAQARLAAMVANPANAALIFSVASVLFCWVLLWLLWRKKIFLKV
jgi:predicted acyltransferase